MTSTTRVDRSAAALSNPSAATAAVLRSAERWCHGEATTVHCSSAWRVEVLTRDAGSHQASGHTFDCGTPPLFKLQAPSSFNTSLSFSFLNSILRRPCTLIWYPLVITFCIYWTNFPLQTCSSMNYVTKVSINRFIKLITRHLWIRFPR